MHWLYQCRMASFMKNFPARLKSARLMNGMSIQDLVDRLDASISKQAISRYENGIMKPSGERLLLLSKALGVKPDYFERDIEVSLEEPSFRKLKSLPVKEQDRINQKAIDYLERYLELESILGEETSLNISLFQYEVDSLEKIEEAAENFREKMAFGSDPLLNLTERLEERGIKIVELEVLMVKNIRTVFYNYYSGVLLKKLFQLLRPQSSITRNYPIS